MTDFRPLPHLVPRDTSAQDGGERRPLPYRTRREADRSRAFDRDYERPVVQVALIPETHELVLKQPTGHGGNVRPRSTTRTPSMPLHLRPRGRKRDRGLGGLLRFLKGVR